MSTPTVAPVRLRRGLSGLAALAFAAGLSACSNESEPPVAPAPATVTVTPQATASPAASSPPATASPSATASTSAPATSRTAKDADLAEADFAVSPRQAIAAATERAGKGTVHGIELDYSDSHGGWVYSVDVLVGRDDHEVQIDADTAKVVRADSERTDDRERAINLDRPMTLSAALAKARAGREGRVESWSQGWDDARPEYTVEIVSGNTSRDVTVEAESGRVTEDD